MTYKEQLIKWVNNEFEKGLVDINLYFSGVYRDGDEEEICKEILEAIQAPRMPINEKL